MTEELKAVGVADERYTGITLIGEDGTPEAFEHVLTFMYEGERYMALIPAEHTDGEEAPLVFMHIEPRRLDGEDAYSVVDNEVLLNELYDVFCDLIDEMEDSEEEDSAADTE